MKRNHIIFILLFSFFSAACTSRSSEMSHAEKNAVYYWKTVFELDSTCLDFMDSHNIGRIYLRMFDVSSELENKYIGDRTVPNASVRINYSAESILSDKLSDVEIVPVVYITLDALKTMNNHEDVLAEKIVERVRRMCSYHSLPNVAELQLDCDWTTSTENSFFRLCGFTKEQIKVKNLNWKLSSTIRLHQLWRDAPPVDRGVLMVYNTGNFDDPDAANSIISVADVEPYLRYLSSYPLHLDAAYPMYAWQLIFRNRKFVGLTNGIDVVDSMVFTSKNRNCYMAVRDVANGERIIRKGDMIRTETSDYADIIQVKKLIEQKLGRHKHSTIIYHLDSVNISKYSDDEFDHIFASESRN